DDVDDGVTVLVSPVFDLSGQTEAILSYWRWFANRDLGEDAEDFFRVQATDGVGGWVTLENLGTNESAPSWTQVEFALEDFISLTAQVQVRFMASDGPATGNLIEAAIDDVRIERPVCDDTPACFTEPTFAGADAVVPGASCGETEISWSDATSNCINATITYNVYRDTDPGFTPGAANLIASSLAGTAMSDTLLDPGVEYYYVVRAFDSRSGEDSNLNRIQVTSPASPDLQAPLFNGIDTAASGTSCGDVAINWSAAAETCNLPVSYKVYRSTDPAFVPGPGNLVASTTSLGIVDTALVPGQAYTYVVRASDDLGNVDTNEIRFTAGATNLDLTLLAIDFEPDNADWKVVDPNDAVTGNWEWGDPDDTGTQPGDDHTPAGVNCWVTGLSDSSGNDNNDVDDGSTTLLSKRYDITGAVDPAVRYARWFTNDTGQNPGEDPFIIEVSDNDGVDWHLLEQVDSGPLDWVVVEIPLNGIVTPTSAMLFRFSASDLGAGGSLVEAAVDDFELFDRDQGCVGCPTPVQTVGTIEISRVGDDVLIDWTGDPVSATTYVVHQLSGSQFEVEIDVGSTTMKSFIHQGAALSGEDFFYRVTAIDACGNESPLQ
ncbi:MAG: hypothetical protein R3344_06385, partial [Acidobacteriota bacterium]|nr:hypothetical protein [Acidobacteriota bacterium]